ncbi:MAG: hypothetical protein O6918_06175 [Deltaproteobacteria bacterium]|nr:hypothetical protein [Deltaproteobacteria bacterium]MCZ6907013.1 hypothetical protein [Deltaproteobacteria bacterium]
MLTNFLPRHYLGKKWRWMSNFAISGEFYRIGGEGGIRTPVTRKGKLPTMDLPSWVFSGALRGSPQRFICAG